MSYSPRNILVGMVRVRLLLGSYVVHVHFNSKII
jgi:hypothetical protein